MKQFLLTTMCTAVVLTAAAGDASDMGAARVSKAAFRMEAAQNTGGLKRMKRPVSFNNIVNPVMKQGMRKASDRKAEETLLTESFENGGKLPEGWSIESKGSADLADHEKWTIGTQWSPYVPAPADGDYYAYLFYSKQEQDEWLISPEIQLGDATYELSMKAYINPGFFYIVDDEHVAWDNMEWKKQELCSTFQILASVDGGEWEVVRDFGEEYMGVSYSELASKQISTLEKYNTDLGKYAGKKIRLALRLKGHDSDMLFIDDLRVEMPTPEALMAPDFRTMYYGFSDEAGWKSLMQRIAVYPAYTPIGFSNISYEDVTYSWLYQDPKSGETVSHDDPDYLEVTYSHDIDPATGTAKSFVTPPVLVAEGEGYKTAMNPWSDADLIQIGGASRVKLNTGATKTYGLLPFEEKTYDIGYYTVDCDPIGKWGVPAFGYNRDTDEYWLYYTTEGDNQPGDYCRLTAYYNMIYPWESPLVVEGVNALAYGLISDNAEFKCEIYPFVDYYEDGEFMGQVCGDKPIATAVCKGSDVINRDPTMSSALTIPFVFDSKVVLDNSYAAYSVKISGFHSEEVEFFAPIQQWEPDPNYLCLGWVEKEMDIMGRRGVAQHAMGYYANEFGDMYCSFAICLAGYYPWLESDVKEVSLGNGTTAEIALDSYNDASDLQIEASPWIKATASGRYRDTKLTLTAEPNDEGQREGFVTVKADGQSKTFKVSQQQSGVEDAIAGGNAELKAVYTLDGCEVSGELPAGVYIEVYSDGSARKRVVTL